MNRSRRHPRHPMTLGTVIAVLVLTACGAPGPSTPGAPTDLTATPGDGIVTVAFTPATTDGSAVTNHHVSLDDGATWAAVDPPVVTSPITVHDLVNGDTYALRIRAENAAGAGAPSMRLDVTPIATTFAARFGGAGNDGATDVVVYPDGSAIVVGHVHGDAMVGPDIDLPGTGSRAFVGKIDAGGRWAWWRSVDATGTTYLSGVAAGPNGTAIVSGQFGGTLVLDDAGTLTTLGSTAFIAAIAADGTWLRATQAVSTTASPTPYGGGWRVSTRPDGSGVIAGEFRGTLAFGDASVSSTGFRDGFLAAFDRDLAWRWATRAGGSGADGAYGVVALSDGGALSTGSVEGTASFGLDEHVLVAVGGAGGYAGRVAADGSWTWVTHATGTGSGSANAVVERPDGGFVVGGSFRGEGYFGDDVSIEAPAGESEAFVGHLDPDGRWVWVTGIGASATSWVTGRDLRADRGDVLVTGHFQGAAGFGATPGVMSAGATDVFVAGLTLSGDWTWVARAGGVGSDGSHAIAVSPDQGAIVVGSFSSTMPLAVTDLVSAGDRDGFVAKIGAQGDW